MKKQQYSKQVIDLLQKENLTRQDIAKKLKISMPTALQIINGLLEEGMIIEEGSLESTGGRKAKCLCLNVNMIYVLGINIGLHHVSMILANYGGEVLADDRYATIFCDKIVWYDELRAHIESFLEKQKLSMDKILCAGISFPGIIDNEGGWILHSHVFGLHNVSLDRFQKMLPVPVAVFNDANSGGYAEIGTNNDSYVYLSLNESVGGAVVLNGQLYRGDTYHAGEIGHMLLVPGGKKCYCGKEGCADAYLRAGLLMQDEMDMDQFKERLESGDSIIYELWEEYLEWLAIFATNIRMVFNNTLIIGGEVGKIIDPYLPALRSKMEKYDLFARDIDYIYGCQIKKNAMASGAARLALQMYRDYIFEKLDVN